MNHDAPDGTSSDRPLTLAEAFARDSSVAAPHTPRTRRRRARSYDPAQKRAIAAACALAAAGGALADASPAGWAPADAFWAAAFAGVVALACVPAKRWTWLVLAGAAAVLGSGLAWQAVGVLALGGALVAAWRDVRAPVLGAIVGGLAVQPLLRLDDVGPTGTTAVLVALAVAPVAVSGFRNSRSAVRRRVRYVAGGVVVLLGLVALGFTAGVVMGQGDARRAREDARAGLDALRDGDQEVAERRLLEAARGFEGARSSFTAPWAVPARAVPVLGHQTVALETLAEQGSAVTRSGATGARTADYERLRPTNGRVDLVALRQTQEPLDAIVASLAAAERSQAEVSDHWLAPPLRSVVDGFYRDVEDALPDAELAAEAVQIAPGLLGADEPRRYLLAFAQPAEARYMGGFIGSYGILSADGGRVELERSGSIGELSNAPGFEQRTISGPPEFLARYGRFNPQRFLQNLSATPDMPTLATVAGELVPQTGAGEIDGVVYVDPAGLAALLAITGPVPVEGLDQPLTTDNAEALLLRGQYQLFPDDGPASDEVQEEFLATAADATFDALLSQRLPSPSRLASAIGPATRGNHLMASVHDEEAQAFFEEVGAAGAFPAEPGADWLSVRHTNVNPNKVDAYLERTIDYEVITDPATGEVEATARIVLENKAPAGPTPGLTESIQAILGNLNGDPLGTNRMQLAVFSPLELTAARLADAPVGVETQTEFGGNAYGFTVAVPPGGRAVLELDLRGQLDPGGYRLRVSQPGLASPDDVAIRIRGVDGAVREADEDGLDDLDVEDGVAVWEGRMLEDLEFSVQ